MIGDKMFVAVIVCLLATASVIICETEEKRLQRLVPPKHCLYKECPLLKNYDLRMDFCSYSCPEGEEYVCLEKEGSRPLEFCSPTELLKCGPGYIGSFTVDSNDPSKVVRTVKPCPDDRYQKYSSDCINACKSRRDDFTYLPDRFVVYSNGSNDHAPEVYCNYTAGFYNPGNITLFDFDDQFQYYYSGYCVHISEEDPCVIGKMPLPNGTCVLPCTEGQVRDDHDSFICKMQKSGSIDSKENRTLSGRVSTTVSIAGQTTTGLTGTTTHKGITSGDSSEVLIIISISVVVAAVLIVVLAICCLWNRNRNEKYDRTANGDIEEGMPLNESSHDKETANGDIEKEKYDSSAANGDIEERIHMNGYNLDKEIANGDIKKGKLLGAFKKEHNDLLTPGRWDAMATQHQSVGCLMAYGNTAGTVFRVGTHYAMTAFHIILPLIKKDENGPDTEENFDLSQLSSEEIYGNFNESVSDKPKILSKLTCVFYHVLLDVAVLSFELVSGLPPKMILDRIRFETLKDVYIIGFGNPDNNLKKHIDPGCKVIPAGSVVLKESQAWLRNQTDYFREIMVQNHGNPDLVNEGYLGYDDPHKVLFSCYLEHGASGGPLLTVSNKRCVKVVGIITHGMPEFIFHLPLEERVKFPKKYRFEYGTRMSNIYDVIHETDPALAKDLFGEQ